MGKIRQISYTLVANLLATLVSTLITFVLPKLLGVTAYSYFQLYLFYFGYVGILHFGWADGVFLRYGGQYYEELDKPSFHTQLRQYGLFQVMVSCVLLIGVVLLAPGPEKSLVFGCTCVAAVFMNVYVLLQYILQATGRIREYATLVIAEKTVYAVLVFAFLLFGARDFLPYITASMIGVVAAVALGFYHCRDILLAKPVPWKEAEKESRKNLSVGIKLMLANLASQLIIGIVGQAIEIRWGVEQFGVVSLSLSISNMLMLLINAVSVVLFPMLRRMERERLVPMYKQLRSMLMIPLFCVLVLYYPGKLLLSFWLPQYAEGLNYLGILFPICIFESKMSMLINTYLKALRKEKLIMWVNLFSVGMSLLLSVLTVFILQDITLAVASILVLLAGRSVLAEVLLARRLGISVWKDNVAELLLVAVFVVGSWVIGNWTGAAVYAVVLCGYGYWKKDEIGQMISSLKRRNLDASGS